MNNLWLKTGCILTGYNYKIVKSSSEATARTVKKYFSAMLIIIILWGFIGYSFAQRYLDAGFTGSALVALVMILIVIQVERQIILSSGRNWLVPGFRALIGIVMAIIGSVIIDQIIFKDDIEKGRISNLQAEANDILPEKTLELDNQIMQIDLAIAQKEAERASIIDEITARPFIKTTSAEIKHFQMQTNGHNGESRDTLVRKTDYTLTDVQNPKAALLPGITDQINQLRRQKSEKEISKINARQELETELKSKTGFLDELNVLFSVLLSSTVAMTVWSMMFLVFMSLEVLVIVNRYGEDKNDYDRVISHQMDTRMVMLDNLTKNQLQN